jgi:hypothetical protein
MMRSDNQRRAKLFLYMFAAIGLTLLCICWAVYSFRQAILKTVAVLEPSFAPVLVGQGNLIQRCLFDFQYRCSEVFFAQVWQRGNIIPLYGIAGSLMLVVWVTRKFKPGPLYNAAWAIL